MGEREVDRAEGQLERKFDAQGKLVDETTRKLLRDLLAGFKPWIERMKPE